MASLKQSQPWLALGISRATWFRRQKENNATRGRTKPRRRSAELAPVIDAAIPPDSILKASAAEVASIRKAAAIGPGAVITKTHGWFDVVTPEAFAARQRPPAPRESPPAPSRELAAYRPPLQGEVIRPPRSMIADGGTPARRYPDGASIAEATALIRAHAAEQARVNAEMARRLAELERYVEDQKRDKAAKAAGVAKWAEAQRLFFNMLRP